MIVAVAHLVTQRVVRRAGSLSEVGRAVARTRIVGSDLFPKRDQMFECLIGHLRRWLQMPEPECLVGRLALGPLELDFKMRAPIGGGSFEQVSGRGVECVGEFLQ